jgi:signal transduction histidine kinase
MAQAMGLESGSEGRLTPDGGDRTAHAALEQLHAEVDELRASRERLVHAADADRSRIERELHEGVQQHLVALAVKLQLAETSAGSDRAATRGLLEEMRGDVEEALDEAARLAQRISAPLELGGLAVALRAAAATAGVPATVDVEGASSYPDEVARTVYLCWLEALEAADGEEPAIRVWEEDGRLIVDLSAATGSQAGLERLRDRFEALGGSLEVDATSAGVRISGSLPL